MRIRKALLAVMALIVCPVLPASAQKVVGLKECVEEGLKNNYSIRIVRGEEQIARNNASLGNAGYLPVAGLSGGASGTENDTRNRLAGEGTVERSAGVTSETANAGATLNWTIFDGMGIQAEYARLKELKLMGQLNTRLAVEDFVADISSEYYNLIRQETRLKNLRSNLDLSRERVRIVATHYAIGSKSGLELQQAQVDLNSDSSKVINQLEVLHISRIRLNRLMAAADVERPLAIRDTLIHPDTLFNRNELWQNTMEFNVSLQIARKDVTLSSLELKKVQSRNYPYVKLNAGYGYTATWNGSGTFDRQERLGLNYGMTVGLDLFDGMNRRREQRNARIRIENQRLAVEDMQLALEADMSNFWMAYRNNIDLWELEQENLVVARKNYDIALYRYKLGGLSGIELREAQNSLFEAEERLSIAQYSVKVCEISLLQLSGRILPYIYPAFQY